MILDMCTLVFLQVEEYPVLSLITLDAQQASLALQVARIWATTTQSPLHARGGPNLLPARLLNSVSWSQIQTKQV